MSRASPALPAPDGGFVRLDILVPAVAFAALALAPAGAALGVDPYILSLLGRVMIFAMAAIALDFILGYAGLLSFGHAAFIGIGAYAVSIATAHGQTDILVQAGCAAIVAATVAGATGVLALRTQGVYFIMITLAFAQMLFFLATSLAVYGGDDGMSLSLRSTVFGSNLLDDRVTFYYVTFACLLTTYAFFRVVLKSRFGRVVQGARENLVRMRAMGFDTLKFLLLAYVLAGVAAALAGVLLANQAKFVSPAYMNWSRSGELIIMVVLGGTRSLHGAVIGAAIYILLAEALSNFTQNWAMIFGPILVLVVLFARGGLLGLLQRLR